MHNIKYPTIKLSLILTFEVKTKKDDVIPCFGSVESVTEALGIPHVLVSGWRNVIPKDRVFEIQALTDEELKVNPAFYTKLTHSMAKT